MEIKCVCLHVKFTHAHTYMSTRALALAVRDTYKCVVEAIATNLKSCLFFSV